MFENEQQLAQHGNCWKSLASTDYGITLVVKCLLWVNKGKTLMTGYWPSGMADSGC